jgi:1-phosphatidylinositol-3-phosphate 5-kinase
MSSQNSPRAPSVSGMTLTLPSGLRSRRSSLGSLGSASQVDKEQLAQALDAIHSTASQSGTLTTFNEFSSPPLSSSAAEHKGLAGDLIQNGLSGLYSRFRGAVGGGKDKTGTSTSKNDNQILDIAASQTQKANTTSKSSSSAIPWETGDSSLAFSNSSSRLQSPTGVSSTSLADPQFQSQQSSKSSFISSSSNSKAFLGGRPGISPIGKPATSSAVVPTVAPVNVGAFKDRELVSDVRVASEVDQSSAQNTFDSNTFGSSADGSLEILDDAEVEVPDASDCGTNRTIDGNFETRGSLSGFDISSQDTRGILGADGIEEGRTNSSTATAFRPMRLALQSSDAIPAISPNQLRQNLLEMRRPASIDRITQSHLPGYIPSRASSTDRSIAEANPINTSAHTTVHHDMFSAEEAHNRYITGQRRIPGTTTNEGNPDAVNSRLEQMRKQVLSKEFWMADDICKECFLCGDPFTAFRRKHHCRTCGCIFDSKCTSTISGERFGVQGTLRVCRTCLDIIHRRHDSSGSDESADDTVLPASFFQSQQMRSEVPRSHKPTASRDHDDYMDTSDKNTARPIATPMMAIPATRRLGESANRRSAILEIDVPQLSRPSSSRSLKAISGGRPPSSGQKGNPAKHTFLGRFRGGNDGRPPFHRDARAGDMEKRSRLPAFHDDNIIDPDLAPYMSDDGSSGDEQMSIFTALNGNGTFSASFENERSGFGSLLTAGKKHRSRAGDKSISGLSFVGRGAEESSWNGSAIGHPRPNRRRNLSASSNIIHHTRGSPRQNKHGNLLTGFGDLSEEAGDSFETPLESSASGLGQSKMTRSASMRDAKAPAIELNNASLHHVRRLLRQLLQDANIANVGSWERALVPILLQCTDDVNPDVRRGDDIDIRHYVKLKKIPGGKPGDTSYVSGVVFTKNLALKSMPRNILEPRIVIVSFPIEYQRHQQQFMSLEPVIAQEKEFLKNMVNRIASLQPHVVLVQKHISGLALQYLAEANIAVVYNVKQSVIEAVSRCAETEIISSIDMVSLKPVHVGKSASFDVKTYMHDDIPGKKKTCIYISGCPKELGCTIVLRGASMSILSKMKRITEFMVYVVYNLKLETCLMRDEFVLIPSIPDDNGSLSTGVKQATKLSEAPDFGRNEPIAGGHNIPGSPEDDTKRPQIDRPDQDDPLSSSKLSNQNVVPDAPSATKEPSNDVDEVPRLVSAHESHVHGSHSDAVPEDIPMPTFYSDMVAKHQTKILSASPFVKFMQPYLLMNAREQERRLVYLKRLRDQDTFEEQTEIEKSMPQRFQLIQPEMVHETVKGAPKQIMEVLHAVHDAEYDKALHNYQTQKRQWENYIQGNLNLFDPYAHQNIVVLYTVVCTATTVPCAGPELLALSFYNEHETSRDFDPDCTLGQYVEDLCLTAETICTSNGCERKMTEHHRTYVHGEARITVFVESSPCKINGLQDSILMWSYCKICKKETQVMPMSESTWKYSFGKYLELSFWSSGLHLRAGFCPHDLHRDHLRYFGFRNVAMRIHYDPIDLLEIVVPRTRITWKVDNDLRLKNELFTKTEERWNRFMASVKSRIKGINIDSVVPEKADACKAEVELLTKRAQDEHLALLQKLQEKYMESKYYEIIPMNRAIRAMQEKVAEWDAAFADFDGNFFPSEKDIRRLAALQLKKMFLDRDASATSLISNETAEQVSDVDEMAQDGEAHEKLDMADVSPAEVQESLNLVVEDGSPGDKAGHDLSQPGNSLDVNVEGHAVRHLDLAIPWSVEDETSRPVNSPPADGISRSSDVSTQNSGTVSCEESLVHNANSPEITLSEKVQQLRRANQSIATEDQSSIPRPHERVPTRRTGMAISLPMTRTQSQPANTLRRLQPPSKLFVNRGDAKPANLTSSLHEDTSLIVPSPTSSSTEPAKDKRLSERLGLGTLKSNRKSGHSLIPRSIQAKRNESKVSTLAKHFEQLSREFEKERLRDRKQRAAKVTQSRAFPKASSKPIVEVYKDVNEAVEERRPSEDDNQTMETSQFRNESNQDAESAQGPGNNAADVATVQRSSAQMSAAPEEIANEVETDDNQPTPSQTASDDDGAGSDAEQSLLDDIPDVTEITELVSEPSTDLDLPKHEKSSLMKMLTNFWAERSASGWTQLEYPLHASDHVFVDSDVIVREDEPSSLIAFALSSEDYLTRLEAIRRQGQATRGDMISEQGLSEAPKSSQDSLDQADVETSLLRATGTHLKYQFVEGSAKMLCKIFYAEQFDAVRRKCSVADRIVESLSRCLKWDSKGGKTKSVFLKTLDDRLVLKSLSPVETQAFLRFAPAYFNIMAEALFHELPTVIAKMLGFYQIIIKNPITGTEIKWDVLVMENLFYDRSPTRIFDLKGSMRNRKIQSTGEQNEVLLDENMVEFIYESPLFTREHSKKLLRASVFNDTLFLARQNVMDYSLMVAVDEARKELVVGIIDCIRTYTWDKKLESWIKDRGFAGGGRNRPTVTSPKEYKSRFREAMARYVLQAPKYFDPS